MKPPWEKFSLPDGVPAYARGSSAEFVGTLRSVFGPLVERVRAFPLGQHAWLMEEIPSDGSLPTLFRDLAGRLQPAGSLWVVFPKKPFLEELRFPFLWSDVQTAGLGAQLVDNKVAAFSRRLTSIRFVIPVSRRAALQSKIQNPKSKMA